jgi:hypothetical protein
MNLITYLNRHLLEASGFDGALLAGLQQRGMAPAPAYRLRIAVECDSFFGAHSESCEAHYYASGTPGWLADVAGLPDGGAAYALFAQRYRDRVAALDAVPRTEEYLIDEWRHFLEGTYGLWAPEVVAQRFLGAETGQLGHLGQRQVLRLQQVLDDGHALADQPLDRPMPVASMNWRCKVRVLIAASPAIALPGVRRRGWRAPSPSALPGGPSSSCAIGRGRNCAWPPSRCGGTTRRCATILPTWAPWSRRTRCSSMSRPAAEPAEVITWPLSTYSASGSRSMAG